MPFGTSTKERLCTEMNNYPKKCEHPTPFSGYLQKNPQAAQGVDNFCG